MEENYTCTDDYFLTFHEDGTLTAKLDREKTGTWEYIDLREFTGHRGDETYSYFSWEYRLTFQGESHPMQLLIRCDGDESFTIYVPHPENPGQKIAYMLAKDS